MLLGAPGNLEFESRGFVGTARDTYLQSLVGDVAAMITDEAFRDPDSEAVYTAHYAEDGTVRDVYFAEVHTATDALQALFEKTRRAAEAVVEEPIMSIGVEKGGRSEFGGTLSWHNDASFLYTVDFKADERGQLLAHPRQYPRDLFVMVLDAPGTQAIRGTIRVPQRMVRIAKPLAVDYKTDASKKFYDYELREKGCIVDAHGGLIRLPTTWLYGLRHKFTTEQLREGELGRLPAGTVHRADPSTPHQPDKILAIFLP
jgi:hypothetical protein